ncbi:hypothetical protein [Actinomycetospora sp. TBRC 11914]|uniref:hypothetical protein n=1 Tax=Actinomycetospora sp. TBRC 11914 TaxID=2729387 RepID=UPI001B7D4F3A|nr:hypothetical protein [Actinomycetospora sp. TBRC 11914]
MLEQAEADFDPLPFDAQLLDHSAGGGSAAAGRPQARGSQLRRDNRRCRCGADSRSTRPTRGDFPELDELEVVAVPLT